MMMNRSAWVLLAGLALLLAAGTLWAFPGPQAIADDRPGSPRSSGARGVAMMDELGLTDQQRQQMRALHNEARKAGIRSRADLQLKRMELEDLLEADEPNPTAVDKALRELNDLRAATLKRRIEQRLAFRRLLTPEQRTKLRGLREQRQFQMRRSRHPRRFEDPGWGDRGGQFQRQPGFRPRGDFGPGGEPGPDFDIDFDPEPPALPEE